MKRRALFAAALLLGGVSQARDPGKESLGEVAVRVYYGTDGDPSAAGPRAREAGEAERVLLGSRKQLTFAHYRLLGTDIKPLFRSYENWAQPIEGSKEILCRFEVSSRISPEAVRIDLELWLSRKKILKSGLVLTTGRPVLVLGPQWRGGHLIIAVELASATDRAEN